MKISVVLLVEASFIGALASTDFRLPWRPGGLNWKDL
jgi:hypothetical protein